MICGYERNKWNLVTAAAIAVVGILAFPAVAAEPSATDLQVAPSAPALNAPVELIATVSCDNSDPSGGLGVTFFDGPDILATVPVPADGQVTYATSFSTTGSHTITAAYNGNDECSASNDTATVEVSSVPAPLPGFCFIACGGSVINYPIDVHNNFHLE
ncbi:Ig-like domain-containing protein [Streptomyces sp. NPDC088354]|uniref:Ig-like domain-containing protein n=1 Tax=Streptomyces sp. NPDC088354 TaxID=3365856 RepID=UPI00380AA51C